MSKKKKVRVELRKNREKPPRENDLTRAYQEGGAKSEDAKSGERVKAKGNLSRYRTVVPNETEAGSTMLRRRDPSATISSRYRPSSSGPRW